MTSAESALRDLEDDYFRTGEVATPADVDRAASRHGLDALEHARLLQQAADAGYLALPQPTSDPNREHGTNASAPDGATSIQLLIRDVSAYPLLSATEETELARAVEAGTAAAARLELGVGAHDRQLLNELVERGTAARCRFAACNMRLVLKLARSFTGQGLEYPDLVQAGTPGLIRAVEKFDWRKGFKFSTYATHWIRQSISRELANTGRLVRLPVHIVERVRTLKRVTRELEQRKGDKPSFEELAVELSWDPAEVAFLQDQIRDPISLDAPMGPGDDSEPLLEAIATTRPGVEQEVLDRSLADDIETALELLDPRSRRVLTLRYGLFDTPPQTLEQIGRELSVTRERVRQIENIAKKELRSALSTQGYGPA